MFLQAHLIMILSRKGSTTVPSVLIVDDDRDNLHLVGYVLEAMKLEYYGVSDSSSVLDLVLDKAPDLILLDIVMPHLSGFDVMRQLKSNLITKNIPVIAVTALISLYHEAEMEIAGFDDYICKPFILEELEAKIADYLNFSLIEAAA